MFIFPWSLYFTNNMHIVSLIIFLKFTNICESQLKRYSYIIPVNHKCNFKLFFIQFLSNYIKKQSTENTILKWHIFSLICFDPNLTSYTMPAVESSHWIIFLLNPQEPAVYLLAPESPLPLSWIQGIFRLIEIGWVAE